MYRRELWNFQIIKTLLFLAALLITFAGCSFFSLNKNEPREEKAVLGLLTPDTLNPLCTKNEDYFIFSSLIYDSIFSYDSEGNLIKSLAKSYDETENKIIVTLRDDVKFHNGAPLTAEDIIFTIDVMQYAYVNYGETFLSPFVVSLGNLRRAEIISDGEVAFYFNSPYAFNKYILTFPVFSHSDFPEEGIEKYEKALAVEKFSPNGSGTYKFLESDKNSLSFSGENGARFRSLKVDFFSSEVLAKDALISGKINFWKSNKKMVDKFQKNDKMYSLGFPSNKCEFIAFNQESPMMQGNEGRFFRSLIRGMLDRREIIKKIYAEDAEGICFPALSLSSFSIENNSDSSFEKNEIQNRLKGFVDKDNDGFLEDAEGRKLMFRIVVNDNDFRIAVCEMLKAKLMKIGIELEILVVGKGVDSFSESSYYELFESVSNLKNCDLLYLGVELSEMPTPYFFPKLSSDSKVSSFIAKDSELEKLYLSYSMEIDEGLRKVLLEKICRRIEEVVPYVFLVRTYSFIYSNYGTGSIKESFYYRWCDFLKDDSYAGVAKSAYAPV